MSRHSKNNSAGSVFTYAEKQKLSYGTQKSRLGRDSMRKLDCCYLCLNVARNPCVCPKGHLACKECIISNILSQKEAIKKEKKRLKLKKSETSNAQVDFQKKKALDDFLAAQEFTGKTIQDKKETLPSFWVPSLTPNVEKETKSISLQVTCPFDSSHSISLKDLLNLEFKKDEGESICAACKSLLSNNLGAKVLSLCGHVLCSHCCKLVKKKCSICNESIDKQIEIVTEGTGYSSKGGAESEKYTFAFQC